MNTTLYQHANHLPLRARLRVITAVARRELTIFLRYPSWIVSMILWPVIFPAAYILSAHALAGPDGSGLALFEKVAGTSDYIGYIAVGTTIWMWQNIVLWSVGYTLREEQRRGTLESNWMTPAWRFSYLLGSSLGHLFEFSIFLLVAALEFTLFFGVRLNGSLFLVFLTLLACVPSIYGLGIVFASLVIAAKEASAFVFLVRGFVMIFCGITFPVALLPEWMQSVARWLPQTYMIHAVRGAALGGADFQALWPDIRALIFFGAFWLTAGYLSFNWMDARARRKGTLGTY